MAKQHDLIGPVSAQQRIQELDVLRGIALFGVLLVNFVAFASPYVLASKAQLAALPTAVLDSQAQFAVRWLFADKANTMFATLFGLGFYLQMKRGEGRPGFEVRYRRRLFWLLVIGWLNILFLWVWDILNLYGLAGFALLAMRNWRTRSLVIFGSVAALYSAQLQEWWTGVAGLTLTPESFWSDPAALERQAAVLSGDYSRMVAMFWQWTVTEWLVGGGLVAWFIYVLGRFALGGAIGRCGLLDDIPGHLPQIRRVASIALPLGLVLALIVSLLGKEYWTPFEGAKPLGEALRSPVALLLTAGYAAGIVVALQTRLGGRLFGVFASVGRMALTNYLAQGLLYAFVMTNVGPSLGLAGRIGTSGVIATCIAFFAFQTVFSHWWLARFRFGPMEWLWRALTYGERPQMRRSGSIAATA